MARSVAQTLAQQLGRAARLGIPLQELPGVAPYLAAALERQSALASIAVVLPDGRTLHAVGPSPLPAMQQTRFAWRSLPRTGWPVPWWLWREAVPPCRKVWRGPRR